MPITLPAPSLYASSISPQTGIFFARNLSANSVSVGTPGLNTANEISSKISSGNSPRKISAVTSGFNFALTDSTSNCLFSSNQTGLTPERYNASAAPVPLSPVPTTNTFLSFNSFPLDILHTPAVSVFSFPRNTVNPTVIPPAAPPDTAVPSQ